MKRTDMLKKIEIELLPVLWVCDVFKTDTISTRILEFFEENGTANWDPENSCIDCGVETQPGKGSARCPSCWEDRCVNYGT